MNKYKIKIPKEEFIPGQTRINYGGRVYDEREVISLMDAASEFWLTSGRFSKQFENDLAKYLGVKYCILCNSGSSANLLAITSLTSNKLDKRLTPGDEVITLACGFPTTLNPIIQNNLIPVFVDIDLGTYNIKIDDLESALSDKTKAVFIPHTLGNPANLNGILKFTDKYNLWLIEDNCDALGSKYENRFTGTFGHISTLSFYPAHHITTGEGGAVCTDDPLLKDIIISFRDWGRDCNCETGQDNSCGKRFEQQLGELPLGYDHKYVYSHIGYNLKMTDLQASIGVEQLKKLPYFKEERKKNFKKIFTKLKDFEEYFILPKYKEDVNWFGFPIYVKPSAPFSRDDMVRYLENNKIATRMLFGGNLLKQPAYKDIKHRVIGNLENTNLVMNNLFWIGVYPGLTEEMMGYVTSTLEQYLKSIFLKTLR